MQLEFKLKGFLRERGVQYGHIEINEEDFSPCY